MERNIITLCLSVPMLENLRCINSDKNDEKL